MAGCNTFMALQVNLFCFRFVMQFNEQPNFSEPNAELYGNSGKVCDSVKLTAWVLVFSILIKIVRDGCTFGTGVPCYSEVAGCNCWCMGLVKTGSGVCPCTKVKVFAGDAGRLLGRNPCQLMLVKFIHL